MKIAVTIWGNRISPVFDSARTLLVVQIENRHITRQFYTPFDPESPVHLITTLKSLEIDTLVCGAISREPADLISEHNIHLISFVTGNVRKFLDSFVQGRTVGKKHMMPGFSPGYRNAY
ncbi:MAG TPA: NifB/NifX family molybdenum-iron cluster-binding protein [Desulfotignum sp.]|nr:NifB/NifX family molybdenum-iron cluster-binding protein [Desulfotignum sp.]